MIEQSHTDRATDPQTVAAIRESFNDLLDQNKPDKSYVMGKNTYYSYLAALAESPRVFPTSPKLNFPNRKRFKVLVSNNQPFLARAHSNKRVYYREEIFDIIFTAHCSFNHCDGRRTYAVVKEFADNIFLWQCLLVTKLCYCKRVKSKSSKVRHASSPRTKAGDIHLINMETFPDNLFKWILLYKDDSTNFLFARPLRTRDREEIAFELLHLFLNHGAPLFINSSLSKGFMMKLLQCLYNLWSECPTIYGQQLLNDNHPEFLKNLEQWMKKCNVKSWSIGCAFVASALNAQESMTLGCTPYSLMHRTTLEPQSMNGEANNGSFEKESSLGEQETNTLADEVASEDDIDDFILRAENEEYTPSIFPISESDQLSFTDLVEYFKRIKVIENQGKGECLFYVVQQHIKAFKQFEYRVETLRRMVSEFLLSNEMCKDFLQNYHQDVDARDLAKNTGRSSWGGPETLLAISQIFNLHVTLLSFIRPEGMVPYVSKYWPEADDHPASNTLPTPSVNHIVIKFEKCHYTLLFPKDLEYPPKRYKRERRA